MSAKVFVGNLSYSTTKEELSQLLSEAGQVVDVYIPTDRATGRPRGFAFATFSSDAEAAQAIKLFHQRDVGGRRLNVNEAEERPRRSPGGPRPGGDFGGPRRFDGPPRYGDAPPLPDAGGGRRDGNRKWDNKKRGADNMGGDGGRRGGRRGRGDDDGY